MFCRIALLLLLPTACLLGCDKPAENTSAPPTKPSPLPDRSQGSPEHQTRPTQAKPGFGLLDTDQEGKPAAGLPSADEIRASLLAAAEQLRTAYSQAPQAHAVMALVQSRLGAGVEAEACWKKCLSLDPQFADAHHALGDIALERGDYEQAEKHYQEALRIDPARPDARHRLAEAFIGNGKMTEAIGLLEAALPTTTPEPETYFWLAQAALQAQDYQKAVEYHQASIRLDPGNTYSYYGLATACTRLGRDEEAQQYLEKFRQLKAADQQAERERMASANDDLAFAHSAAFLWSAMAEVYARLGNLATAERCWLQAGTLHPEDLFSREKLVALYLHQQRNADAIAVMARLAERHPQGRTLVSLGVLHARQGNFEGAEAAFQEAVRIAPTEPAGYVALARLYVQSGRNVPKSLELARKAVELAPVAPHYMALAETAAKNGQLDEARQAAERAAELDPTNAAYKQAYESLQGEVKP